jgi:CO/xanthine dehydrogenase Mo-binding subunit
VQATRYGDHYTQRDKEVRAVGSMIGPAVAREEDPTLLTGRGAYVDDIRLPGTVHMAHVRSVSAHARVLSVDTGDAANRPSAAAMRRTG